MAGVLNPRGLPELDAFLGNKHELVINRCYLKLMDSQIDQGKYKGLWGVNDNGHKYELYYTERSIESLNELLMHYHITGSDRLVESKKKARGTSATDVELGPDVEPLSPLIYPKESYLPILDGVVTTLKKSESPKPFANIKLFVVLHILNDLVAFLKKYNELGCDYNNMYLVSKGYGYPDHDVIIEHLKHLGCQTYVTDQKNEHALMDTVASALRDGLAAAHKAHMGILVVEDGGYFSSLIHKEKEFESAIALCRGGVEQTTKGHRRVDAIPVYGYPIISVAHSELKSTLEGQQVAGTLQENIVFILNKFAGKPLYKVNALILGIGTIGRMLAQELKNKKITVFAYDINPNKLLQAEIDKLEALEQLNDLSKMDIIIGTSGENSLEDYYNLKHNVLLVSGSSEWVEFDTEKLFELSGKVEHEGMLHTFTLKKEKKLVRLIMGGEPINFALSGGIPDPIIDPIYAEMLLSSVEVIDNADLKKLLHGIPRELELKVLTEYKKYYLT